jgi:hypothetical protein
VSVGSSKMNVAGGDRFGGRGGTGGRLDGVDDLAGLVDEEVFVVCAFPAEPLDFAACPDEVAAACFTGDDPGVVADVRRLAGTSAASSCRRTRPPMSSRSPRCSSSLVRVIASTGLPVSARWSAARQIFACDSR